MKEKHEMKRNEKKRNENNQLAIIILSLFSISYSRAKYFMR